jgi:cell division septal protein FtsQ
VGSTPEAQLLRLAAIEPGSSGLALDTAAIARRVESEPWVRRARVWRPWPGSVRVSVDEYEPVARVEIARRIYGICRGLQVVPSADEALPLIRTRGREATDPDALGRGLEYLASLRKAGLLKRERVELELTAADGDRLTLPDRGFAAVVDGSVPIPTAVENASFLEG